MWSLRAGGLEHIREEMGLVRNIQWLLTRVTSKYPENGNNKLQVYFNGT